MGFGRKRKIRFKIIFLILFNIVIITAGIIAIYYYYQKQIEVYKTEYEKVIEQMKLEQHQDKRIVYMPKEKIKAGSKIEENLLIKQEVRSNIQQKKYMDSEDIGKIAIIDIEENNPIYKIMLTEESVTNDLREQEFNMIFLPSNIEKGDYIDVRIGFPNGEDYIVLSKKLVRDVNTSSHTVWIWLNEEEILTMSSAIVDAYIHKGTKLYTVAYVEPTLQKEAITNYPVNTDVLTIINENPNIVVEASKKLSEEVRLVLEEKLKTLSSDNKLSVETGINMEEASRNEIIIENKQNTEEVTMEQVEVEVEDNSEAPQDSQEEEADSNDFF